MEGIIQYKHNIAGALPWTGYQLSSLSIIIYNGIHVNSKNIGISECIKLNLNVKRCRFVLQFLHS